MKNEQATSYTPKAAPIHPARRNELRDEDLRLARGGGGPAMSPNGFKPMERNEFVPR